jgi:hypothetical protein
MAIGMVTPSVNDIGEENPVPDCLGEQRRAPPAGPDYLRLDHLIPHLPQGVEHARVSVNLLSVVVQPCFVNGELV